MAKELSAVADARIVEALGPPQAGCMCDYCVEGRGNTFMDPQVDVIVRNLKTCSPQAVTAALKILASGGPSRRCAFCGTPEGGMHVSGCPFSAAGAPYVNFVPVAPPPKPTITRDPGMGFGTVTQPNGKPIGTPKQVSSASPKDSILNPPVKGFIGSEKYGYDPDVD